MPLLRRDIISQVLLTKQWSTPLSSEVNLNHAMNFRALSDANLVTLQSKFRHTETRELHRAVTRHTIKHIKTRLAVQGNLAHHKTPPSWDPTVGPCLGPYGGPRGGGGFLRARYTCTHGAVATDRTQHCHHALPSAKAWSGRSQDGPCVLSYGGVATYRGTSLMRMHPLLGPYSRAMPRALWWSYTEGRGVIVREVPL